jgi:dihydroorotate dehydrogenase
MVYRGPGLIRAINAGLCRLLERDGFRTISDAVGTADRRLALRGATAGAATEI